MIRKSMSWVALAILAAGLAGASVFTIKYLSYSKLSKVSYLSEKTASYIRPGNHTDITDVTVNGQEVTATIQITADDGTPLDMDGIDTPGPISVSFVLSYIPVGGEHYQAITVREVTSSTTGVTAIQGTSDRTGTMVNLSPGVYRYTFGTLLPDGYDPDATYTVGLYSTRDLQEFDLDRVYDNQVFHFVPSGGEMQSFRDVVATDTCNSCHDPLAIHGGRRQAVELCIMCHNPGTIDPDSGNSVDMAEMVHKIHMGASLPSVQAGIPYQIIGNRNSVHDYSNVHFPQDIRNCETCHKPDVTLQHDNWILNPTRRSCGACHDDVNFASGEGHEGGPQITDNLCSSCHFEQGELEFDASIRGGHTVPHKSTQLAGINIEILEVQDASPGVSPTVVFSVTDNDGTVLDPAGFNFFNLLLAGPNEDYNFLVSESARSGAVAVDGGWSYTFEATLPADAAGSFTAGAEAFRNVTLNAGTIKEFNHRETAENPVFAFGIDGATPVARRTVVSDEKCESCHNNLALHGTIRHSPQYCVMCHQTSADDSIVRDPETGGPPRTIDFKFIIHRIHTGHDLTDDYTIIGFGGREVNFNEVHYPGDRRNCEACHEGDTYVIPSPGVEYTPDDNEFFSPMPPNSAACLGCHDTVNAAAHAFVSISPFGESCEACHGETAEFSVALIHAR